MAIDSDTLFLGYSSGDEEVNPTVVVKKIYEESIINFSKNIYTCFFPNLANSALFQSLTLVDLPFGESIFFTNAYNEYFRVLAIEDDGSTHRFAFK